MKARPVLIDQVDELVEFTDQRQADRPRLPAALRDEIVRRIRDVREPLKIVLFGSRARGDDVEHSDVDLLVVEHAQPLPRHRRAVPYYEALRKLDLSKDVVVYTPEEIREWSQVPQAFITTILREGVTLYENSSRSG